jgi:hypothetical protein
MNRLRGSVGSGASGFSPLGALLDIELRRNIAVVNGLPQTIAGTTTSQNYPSVGTFSRASVADWLNSAGTGLETQAASGALRREAVRGALIEQAVTAQPVNSLMQDGSGNWPPADDTLPAGWAAATGGAGITRTISYATVNGMRVMRVRYVGTPSSTGASTIQTQTLVGVIGQTYFQQILARLSSGTLTNVTGVTLRTFTESGGTSVSLTSSGQFFSQVRTLSGTNARLEFRFNFADTVTPVDVEFELAAPMTVRIDGTSLSGLVSGNIISPILTTNSGTVTRAADVLSVPVSLAGDFTTVVVARRPVTATNANDTLLNLSVDASNRIGIRRNTGGNLIANAIVAGSETGSASVTEPSSGARFAVAIRRSGTAIGISLNGGAPVNNTPSSLPGTKVALNVGSNAAGTAQWNDYIERVIVFPTAASDATLQSYSTLATWGG